VWAQPWLAVLGSHQWVLDASASALVGAGLLAGYRLGRLVVGPGPAALACAAVAASAGFLRDLTSFMTDGPAFALGAGALLAGVSSAGATGRRRALLEGGCLVLGLWGFAVREFALAAPVAALVAVAVSDRRRAGRLAAGLAGLLAVAAAGYLWRRGLPHQQPYDGTPPAFTVAELMLTSLFSTALALAPVVAWTWPRWWTARRPRARAVGAAAVGLAAGIPVVYARWSWTGRYQWLVGDYLDRRGINADKLLLGHRPVVLPLPVWAALTAGAVLSAAVLGALVAEAAAGWWSRRNRPAAPPDAVPAGVAPAAVVVRRALVAHLALSVGALGVAAVWNGALYDRYLWPLVLSGAILVVARPAGDARPGRRPGPAVGVVVTAAAVAVALVVTLNSDSFDGARWRAGQRAVAAGTPAARVDAGFEWYGWHAQTAAEVDGRYRTGPAETWWAALFPGPPPCVELSATRYTVAGYDLVGVARWRPWLVAGTARLWTYRSTDASCR